MVYKQQSEAKKVLPGLMLGGIGNLQVLLDWQPDLRVPLDHLSGYVWETDSRGEVLYYPVTDFFFLPENVLDRLANAVTERLRKRKKTAMLCIGEHGRTGYVDQTAERSKMR